MGGKSLYDHIVDWLDGRVAQDTWAMDVDYPGNDSCPKPSEYKEEWRGM